MPPPKVHLLPHRNVRERGAPRPTKAPAGWRTPRNRLVRPTVNQASLALGLAAASTSQAPPGFARAHSPRTRRRRSPGGRTNLRSAPRPHASEEREPSELGFATNEGIGRLADATEPPRPPDGEPGKPGFGPRRPRAPERTDSTSASEEREPGEPGFAANVPTPLACGIGRLADEERPRREGERRGRRCMPG